MDLNVTWEMDPLTLAREIYELRRGLQMDTLHQHHRMVAWEELPEVTRIADLAEARRLIERDEVGQFVRKLKYQVSRARGRKLETRLGGDYWQSR